MRLSQLSLYKFYKSVCLNDSAGEDYLFHVPVDASVKLALDIIHYLLCDMIARLDSYTTQKVLSCDSSLHHHVSVYRHRYAVGESLVIHLIVKR